MLYGFVREYVGNCGLVGGVRKVNVLWFRELVLQYHGRTNVYSVGCGRMMGCCI